jgi:F0F1-type ATP synthase assembly protein I
MLTASFYKRGLYIRSIFKASNTKFGMPENQQESRAESSVAIKFYTALLVGMTGFLVSATFVSVLYYPIFWNLIGFSIGVWGSILKSGHMPGKRQRKLITRSR